jgi:hypothetical protein
MQKQTLLASLGFISILAALLACNLVPYPVTPGPATGTPGAVTDTPEPPSLLRVAYIKGDNVWLWTEGSGSAQLTAAGGASSPSLSGDGQVVAFLRSGELWAVDTDGSNERVLADAGYLSGLATPPDTAEVDKLAWYMDSHTIYFTTLTVAGLPGYHIPRFDLNRVDADSPAGSLAGLLPADAGGVPYVSPDGTKLALAQPTKVVLIPPDASTSTDALTFPMVLTYSEWVYAPELVWLADSSAVRMVAPAHDPLGDPAELSTFWNIPVSGSPSTLTTFLAAPIFMSFPYVSPDGGKVLYLTQLPASLDIHTIASDGTDTTDTTYASFPTTSLGLVGWNPDSQHFVYYQTPTQQRIMAVGQDDPLGDTPMVRDVRWVDSTHYFYLNGDELRLAPLGSPSTLIDSGVSGFDFGFGSP